MVGGVPHSRPRVYIVGIKRMGRNQVNFQWPSPVTPCTLDSLLDSGRAPVASYDCYPMAETNTVARNLACALAKIRAYAAKKGGAPEQYAAIVDVGGSNCNVGIGRCPCITKTRARSFAFYSLQHGSPLTLREMLKLQGFTADEISHMNMVGRPSQVGGLVGNAFTKTVLAAVLRQAIVASEG